MAVLFRWRKRKDDPESIRQWLLQSWVSICFSQHLFLKARTHQWNLACKMLVACHMRNSHQYEIAQSAIRKSKPCNYSTHVFLPILFGVCAGITKSGFYIIPTKESLLNWSAAFGPPVRPGLIQFADQAALRDGVSRAASWRGHASRAALRKPMCRSTRFPSSWNRICLELFFSSCRPMQDSACAKSMPLFEVEGVHF